MVEVRTKKKNPWRRNLKRKENLILLQLLPKVTLIIAEWLWRKRGRNEFVTMTLGEALLSDPYAKRKLLITFTLCEQFLLDSDFTLEWQLTSNAQGSKRQLGLYIYYSNCYFVEIGEDFGLCAWPAFSLKIIPDFIKRYWFFLSKIAYQKHTVKIHWKITEASTFYKLPHFFPRLAIDLMHSFGGSCAPNG